jgi:ABC-type uncharacterized transport system substrate-binding protein
MCMVPQAVRVAVLVNPVNTDTAKMTVRDAQEAAPAMGLQIQPLNATTIGELDSAFETMRGASAPTPSSLLATHFSSTAAHNLSP